MPFKSRRIMLALLVLAAATSTVTPKAAQAADVPSYHTITGRITTLDCPEWSFCRSFTQEGVTFAASDRPGQYGSFVVERSEGSGATSGVKTIEKVDLDCVVVRPTGDPATAGAAAHVMYASGLAESGRRYLQLWDTGIFAEYVVSSIPGRTLPCSAPLWNPGSWLASDAAITHVLNVAPHALPTSLCDDLECRFDGSSSIDPDGTIVNYRWAFCHDGDYPSCFAYADGPTVTYTFPFHGDFRVLLRVTDNAGDTDTRSIGLDFRR